MYGVIKSTKFACFISHIGSKHVYSLQKSFWTLETYFNGLSAPKLSYNSLGVSENRVVMYNVSMKQKFF